MRKGLQVLALIPARGGSKGIKDKNLAKLGGKPLIAHSIAAARRAKAVTRVVVTTDSPRIAAAARRLGAEAPFLRPPELSNDAAPMIGAVQHALAWLEGRDGWIPDVVVLLQPTSPLRGKGRIDEAIRLLERKKADAVVGVCEPAVHPWKCVRFDGGKMRYAVGRPKGPVNRQEFPEAYAVNGALYVSRVKNVERGSLYGKKVLPLVMGARESVDIDGPEDLALAEFYISGR